VILFRALFSLFLSRNANALGRVKEATASVGPDGIATCKKRYAGTADTRVTHDGLRGDGESYGFGGKPARTPRRRHATELTDGPAMRTANALR